MREGKAIQAARGSEPYTSRSKDERSGILVHFQTLLLLAHGGEVRAIGRVGRSEQQGRAHDEHSGNVTAHRDGEPHV